MNPLQQQPPPTDSLWHARAATDDPATSHRAAAAFNASGEGKAQVDKIVAAVTEKPGMDTAELAAAIQLTVVQVGRRGKAMEQAGMVRREDGGGKYLLWFPGGGV